MSFIILLIKDKGELSIVSMHYREAEKILTNEDIIYTGSRGRIDIDSGIIFVDKEKKILFSQQNAFEIKNIKKKGWEIISTQ